MPRGHTQPIATNQVEINLPEGQEVCVVFRFRNQVVAEVAIHDDMASGEETGVRWRELTFEASPVETDHDGELHGLDDNPAGEAWTLLVREDDTARPEWIYGDGHSKKVAAP